MKYKLTYFLSKALRRLRPPAFYDCNIHSTARVLSNSDFRNVTMGRFSYSGYGCRINNCDIGAFCSISENVSIGFGEHRLDYVSTSPVFNIGNNILGTNFAKHDRAPEPKTKIGNDVWIGLNVIILAGVTIGDGAVIGAGSVVTKNVPPYGIWGGVPARQLRQRFDKETVDKLILLAWWDWPEEQIVALAELFDSPNSLIKNQGIE